MPPYIPLELWHQIIRWATLVPAEAITAPEQDPLISSESLLLRTKCIHDSLYEVLDIKLNLCHVSRTWNMLCQDFMYEFLIIRDAAWLPLFLDKINNNKVDSSRILRLDMLSFSKENEGCTANLISLCRELRVFTLDVELYFTYNFQLATALASSPLLVLIELHSTWGPEFPTQLLERVCPKGTTMIFWDCARAPRSVIGPRFFAELPRNPNLNLNFVGMSPNDNGSSAINPHFTHVFVGEYVPICLMRSPRTLQYVNIISFSRGTFHGMVSSGYVSRLPTTLHTLIFYMDELPMTFQVGFLHIRYLGLKGKPPSPADFDFYLRRSIDDYAENQTVLFPALQVIRLIDKELADFLKQRPLQHKLWDYRCQSRGIRLEDDEGKAMTLNNLRL